MEMEHVLRQVAAVLDRAWWRSTNAQNRELLSEVGYAARHFAEELAKTKADQAADIARHEEDKAANAETPKSGEHAA